MKEQKIRIRLKAYDYKLLDRSVEEIVETAKRPVRVLPVLFLFLRKSISIA